MAISKVTQRDIDNLSRLYLDARERLLGTILEPGKGVGTKTYYNTIVRQLNKELNTLRAVSNKFVDSAIPREYHDGLREIYNYFVDHKLAMNDPSLFASIHTDAVYVIAREMQYQIETGLQVVGRQVMRYADLARDEALRQIGLHQTGVKIASGGTISDMRAAMIRELQDNGFMTVQYGEGIKARQVPIDAYATLVARSTTREAGNTARMNQLTENGYDLVQMTSHFPTCDKCAMYQDRVYSISGQDGRFPALSVAFGQYNNIHPNCRHSIHPWIEALESSAEIERMIVFSNQPFEDLRGKKEVKLYKEQQDKGRKLRNELYQYEQYKAKLGDDAPGSLRSFRRIKNTHPEQWAKLQSAYRKGPHSQTNS